MTTYLKSNIHLSESDILFGKIGGNYNLINHLILIAKQFIYNRRFSGEDLRLDSIVNIFRSTFKTEKLSAKLNMKNDIFFRKWAPVYESFNTGNI